MSASSWSLPGETSDSRPIHHHRVRRRDTGNRRGHASSSPRFLLRHRRLVTALIRHWRALALTVTAATLVIVAILLWMPPPRPLVTATRDLTAGSVVTVENVERTVSTQLAASDAVRDIDEVVGRRLTVDVVAGAPLRYAYTKPPQVPADFHRVTIPLPAHARRLYAVGDVVDLYTASDCADFVDLEGADSHETSANNETSADSCPPTLVADGAIVVDLVGESTSPWGSSADEVTMVVALPQRSVATVVGISNTKPVVIVVRTRLDSDDHAQ